MCGLCLCCLFVILSIVTHASSATFKVYGQIGDNVTLPCSYGTQNRFGPSFCWGRGKVPTSKCSDTILSARDGWLTYRQSTRYLLQGKLSDGDVSLTIVHAQRGDAGTYGCRVEVPGWFNDYKVNIRLSVVEVPVEEPGTAKDWTPTTTVAQGTAFEPKTLQTDDLISGSAATEEEPLVVEMKTSSVFLCEEKCKEFFNLGNICRIVAFFFLTTVVILVYVFRWSFLRRTRLRAVQVSVMENFYESVPMSGQWAASREQRHLQNS